MTAEEIPEGDPLHAHELSPADAAVIRMLAGATFGRAASVVLPSGRKVTGTEMARWVEPAPVENQPSRQAEERPMAAQTEPINRVRLVPIAHAPRCVRLSRFRRWKWEVIPSQAPASGGQGRTYGYTFTRFGAGRAIAADLTRAHGESEEP